MLKLRIADLKKLFHTHSLAMLSLLSTASAWSGIKTRAALRGRLQN